MKIDQVESIVEDQAVAIQVGSVKDVMLANLDERIKETLKANNVELQRDIGADVDDGIAEDAPIESARAEYQFALQELVSNVPNASPADLEIIEKLVQADQGLPLDAGAQTRADMEQASATQTQGNEDQTMGEMRMKEFALSAEQMNQAIQMFARYGEVTLTEVCETATELNAALPQQLAEIALQLADVAPEESFDLKEQRLALVEQVNYYDSFVKVLNAVAPAADQTALNVVAQVPNQNELTEADMNARAEQVRNEPRYAGSPGVAGEISESRTGMRYNEYTAAEVGLNLRTDYDPDLGYARSVEWDVGVTVGNFGTRGEYFGRDEALVDIQATQAVHKDLTNTSAERGHAVGQQFSGGDQDIADELMKMSNVWVMQGRKHEGVNQGAYGAVEDGIVLMRKEYPDDRIHVQVEAVIEGEPEYLVNARGKELVVPDCFDFTITRVPDGGGEPVVERVRVWNRVEEDR